MRCPRFTITETPVGPCYRFWNVANVNKPFRLLEGAHMIRLARGAPFVDALNLVYLLGGRQREQATWYKGFRPDGSLDVDFTGLIEQLQACLDQRYTPWLVLDNVPYPMSDPPTEASYGNTAPPAAEHVWHRYVTAALEAIVDAFGQDTVSRWWFRVGTEPDLCPGHWSGTKQQYFDHYDFTVDAVTRLLPDVRIGPGNILNPVEGEYGTQHGNLWGVDIIDHCATGRNARTGGVGTRMDWFSCSWYGRVGVPMSMFDKAIGIMRERLGRYERFADVPLCIGEFAVLHDEHGTRLYSGEAGEWGASFYAGIADRVYHHGIEKVYEWHHATDGVPHPKGHVIAMLERMAGGHRLEVTPSLTPDRDSGVIASRRDDALYLLVYRHTTGREDGAARTFTLTVDAADVSAEGLTEWTVDATHAAWARAFEADCRAAGVEPLPTAGRFEGGIEKAYGRRGLPVWRDHRERYAALATLPETHDAQAAVADGRLTLTVPMTGHCVRLLRLPVR
ncbi:MAG: GH39 family glycosyl hydrolase [Planctomycetota bacterium]